MNSTENINVSSVLPAGAEKVRLIITDMDGTLLDENRQLPEGFFEELDRLYAKGIRFAIASGRSYPTLAAQFGSAADHMILMAENGACIVDSGELIHHVCLSDEQLRYAAQVCSTIDRIYPVYSCLHHVYVPDTISPEADQIIYQFYDANSIVHIHSLEEIPEPVVKVTICDPEGGEFHSFPILKELPAPYKVSLGGFIWVDIFLDTVSKGAGVLAIRQKYDIAYEETMVFGDYLNDSSMMTEGYYSYAMANAHPELKSICRFETLSNTQNGVMHIIALL